MGAEAAVAAGMAAGVVASAAIGTAVLPVVGTAIGAALGAIWARSRYSRILAEGRVRRVHAAQGKRFSGLSRARGAC